MILGQCTKHKNKNQDICIWNFKKNQKKDIPWKLFQLFILYWLAEVEVFNC